MWPLLPAVHRSLLSVVHTYICMSSSLIHSITIQHIVLPRAYHNADPRRTIVAHIPLTRRLYGHDRSIAASTKASRLGRISPPLVRQ